MKKLLFVIPMILTFFLQAEEKDSHIYASYIWNSNGVSMPAIGYQYEKNREKFDFFVAYCPLKSRHTYHYTVASFNAGFSLYQKKRKDVYAKAGVKVANIYCKKDPSYDSTSMVIYPQIGIGVKISPCASLELFYHPIFFNGGKSFNNQSSYFRILYRL